jgi:hypothetical protein
MQNDRRKECAALGLFLLSFWALGMYYALTNPLYSKPDEYYHLTFTQYLLDGYGLPAVDLSIQGLSTHVPVQQEGHQPPAYYATIAGLARLLGMERDPAVTPNLHYLGTATGNRSAWTPYYLAPENAPITYTGRFFSLLCGAFAVLFAYLLVRLFVAWPIALCAAAFVGWNPQFLFITTSFSNDMASVATVNLGLWLLGLAIVRGLTPGRAALLGVVIGVSTLTKLTGLGLLVPLGVVALWHAWKSRRLQPLLWAFLAGLIVLAIDSWWFWRNWQLYRDPLTTSLLTVLLGERTEPVTVAVLGDLASFLWKAYWLDFSPGGIAFAEGPVYFVLGVVCLLAIAGAVVAFVRRPAVRPLFLLTWGWFLLVLISFMRMTLSKSIFMGGGRLLFPAATAVGATLAIGLTEIGGRRLYLAWGGALALGVYALIAPAHYLAPQYPEPELRAELTQAPAHELGVRFGDDAFELVGYDVEQESSAAGQDALVVTYYWRTNQGSTQDLSLFLQLVDPAAQPPPLAQVDTFPTYGALPTRLWPRDHILVDRIELPLPPEALGFEGELLTGLYDVATMQRLPVVDRAGQRLADDAVPLGHFRNGKMITAAASGN